MIKQEASEDMIGTSDRAFDMIITDNTVKELRKRGTNGAEEEEVPSKKLKVGNDKERMKLPVPGTIVQSREQFWNSWYDEVGNCDDSGSYSYVRMKPVRVYPNFLRFIASSHKLALGAFAELLGNSLDEACNGATYLNVDVLDNKKFGNKMLLVEDNGGGMNLDKLRLRMSYGYCEKCKLADSAGQCRKGLMTSTMRLGADVIVFSRCQGKGEMYPTLCVGMLSYTFLESTGKEDILLPMVTYEKRGQGWNRIIQKSPDDWDRNLETLVQWSPYVSEEDLIKQFDFLKGQGTRIVMYNLWEDDQGHLELDFDTDPHDIQFRGVKVNKDEKNIEMTKKDPNSRDFLTFQHSLRSYASFLYVRLPPIFRIILRGKDVDRHNDTCKTVAVGDGIPYDSSRADSCENSSVPANTTDAMIRLIEENNQSSERFQAMGGQIVVETGSHKILLVDSCRSLETKLQEALRGLDEMTKSLEDAPFNMFHKRMSRIHEMRKRLEDASNTIQALLGKLKHGCTSVLSC